MPIYSVFADAARGTLPDQDGQVEVCGEDPGKAAAVVAFPAHFYVLAPGNSVSRRATLEAGYTPIGAEELLPRIGRS